MRLKTLIAGMVLASSWIIATQAEGPRLTLQAINAAEPSRQATKEIDPALIKAQVLLDRASFSPGVIDGRGGENTQKALAAFASANDLKPAEKLDPDVWARLTATSSEPAVVEYTVTADDVKGPFVPEIPREMTEMADLDRLAYRNPLELLAEKFHMDEDLLRALNPGREFDKAGTAIMVANVAVPKAKPEKGRVTRIEIDKAGRAVRAFDKDDKLVAYYPASIGSDEKPAPSGSHKVRAVAFNPDYTYNPDYKFKGVKADQKFRIAPGPNNPVGAVWIDLDVESYGIHGTPEPDKVGKSYSHGCIRLTNWDVEGLARMVQKGTVVDFGQS